MGFSMCVKMCYHSDFRHPCQSGILVQKCGLLCKIGNFVYGKQCSSLLAAGPIFSLLGARSVHFRAESPKCLWYQHTPDCDGECEQDQVVLLLLLLFLCFPYSVPCDIATVAKDSEITSIKLLAIPTSSCRLLFLAVDARTILILLGSRWRKIPLRRDRCMASAFSTGSCCILQSR